MSTKLDVIDTSQALIDKLRFYIRDGKDVGKALLVIRNTKAILQEYEEKIKARGEEIMERENVTELSYKAADENTGEVREFQIRKIEPTVIEEFSPESLVAAIGIEQSLSYLKVNTAKVKRMIAKGLRKKEIDQQLIDQINEQKIRKSRKGYVAMREVSPH